MPCIESIKSRSASHAASFELEVPANIGPTGALAASNEATDASRPIEASTCEADKVSSGFCMAAVSVCAIQLARFCWCTAATNVIAKSASAASI